MICFPNAKINLGLDIVSRRVDGYHNLETIFYPIGLKDALEIVPASEGGEMGGKEHRFFQSGIAVDGEEQDNLVIRALNLIRREREIPKIDVHLLKKIPFGAGLGGGSSDSAFMLKMLNSTFDLGFDDARLSWFASQLGADCPFFIRNRPAFATGTGNLLEEIELDLSRYFFVLVKPDIAIPTAWAYSEIVPRKPDVSLKEIAVLPVESWRGTMKNDFELPIFKKYPEICEIKEQLYKLGAVYASMSGSGSSVFGFFKEKPQLGNQFKNHFVWTDR